MKKMILLSFCSFLINVSISYSQCIFEVNSNGFEYNIDIDLEVIESIYTQQGTTCNVELEVSYDIQFDVIGQPGWWNEELYVLQGRFECVGGSGTSFFNLPNGGGTSTVTSAVFSFNNKQCSDVLLDCPITLDIQGPELNQSVECGTHVASALPVELIDFRQQIKENQIDILWSTASEINLSHFELESTYDLSKWQSIGRIEGGNNDFGSKYSISIPFSSRDRYIRLKMVDVDGSFEYANSLFVQSEPDSDIVLYPNPTNSVLHLRGVEVEEVEILNGLGQRFRVPFVSENSLDVSSLKPGFYTIIVSGLPINSSNNFVKI